MAAWAASAPQRHGRRPEADRDGAEPAPAPARRPPPTRPSAAERERAERERLAAERKARRQELADAEAEEAAARAQQESDEAERDRADERHTAARDRVTELAEALDAARDEEQTALEALRAAATAARDSARDAAAAAVRTTRARTRLEQLPDRPVSSRSESAAPRRAERRVGTSRPRAHERAPSSARVGRRPANVTLEAAERACPERDIRGPLRTDSRARAAGRVTPVDWACGGGGAGTPSEHRHGRTPMTDTATLITQLRVLGQLTRTEAQVARQRVVQASTDAVRDELRQNAADADGRAARIADALRGLGALPDPVTPLLGRVAVLVRGAMEQAQPLDEALLGDLALEHQLRDRARYVAALAAAADRACGADAGRRARGRPRRDGAVADLGPRGPRRRAGGPRGVAATARGGPGHPGGERSEPAGARRGGRDGHANRRDGDRSGQGGRQGRQGHRRAVRRPRRRLGVEAADTVVATGRGAAAQVSDAAGHVAGAAADAVVTGRDVAAQTAGQLARHLPGSGLGAPSPRTHPRPLRSSARRPTREPARRRRSRGSPTCPAHAAVAALRTLDDPRAVAAMLEFEQAHGNRPGVVAAARLRATAVRTG